MIIDILQAYVQAFLSVQAFSHTASGAADYSAAPVLKLIIKVLKSLPFLRPGHHETCLPFVIV